MDNISIGDILHYQQEKYRCLAIYKDACIFCLMDVSYLHLWIESYSVIFEHVQSGIYKITQEKSPAFDKSKLEAKSLDYFNKKLNLVQRTCDIFGPTFIELEGRGSKPALRNLLDEFQISNSTFWRTIVPYLQSGMSDYALLNKRLISGKDHADYKYNSKPGKKTSFASGKLLVPDDYKNFDEAIEELENNKIPSLVKAFNSMNSKHYMQPVMDRICLMEPGSRPSFNQFKYYVNKNINTLKRLKNNTSEMEVRNNQRFIVGDNLNNVFGPMDLVEIDACEVDLSVVYGPDKDTDGKYKSIGRPIMYAMVDVYTRAIVAVSVAIDNNSYIGVSNLFMNLGRDKYKYAKEYGIEITDMSLWPSQCLPKRVRVDRGAEFRGREFSRLCAELNIQKELLPPGCGSLKGQVEQLYHQMHSDITPHISGAGFISKRFDSKHHEESTLTLEEFNRLLIVFVLVHNQSPIKNYPYSADMIEKGIIATPQNLWEYGISIHFQPKPINNLEQYLFDLRIPCKASMSTNKGIHYRGLYYLPENDKGFFSRCRKLGRKSQKIEIRIDPRSVDDVWYLLEGKVIKASLNKNLNSTKGFAGMTWTEYEEYSRKMKEIKYLMNQEKEKLGAEAFAVYKSIVEPSKKRKKDAGITKSETKNMRELREIAKHDEQYRNRTSRILEDEQDNTLAEPDNALIESNAEQKICEAQCEPDSNNEENVVPDTSFEAFFKNL